MNIDKEFQYGLQMDIDDETLKFPQLSLELQKMCPIFMSDMYGCDSERQVYSQYLKDLEKMMHKTYIHLFGKGYADNFLNRFSSRSRELGFSGTYADLNFLITDYKKDLTLINFLLNYSVVSKRVSIDVLKANHDRVVKLPILYKDMFERLQGQRALIEKIQSYLPYAPQNSNVVDICEEQFIIPKSNSKCLECNIF